MRQKIVIDQMHRKVKIPIFPKRIISLVPSQTELLFDLGLDEEVVGITKFCVHPQQQFKIKPKVGGTKKYNFEKIKALQPDLIIGNKEENDQSQIEALAKEYPVWMSDISTFEEALDMIFFVGEMVNKVPQAEQLLEKILLAFHAVQSNIPFGKSQLSVAYFIWQNPIMVAASQTFIHEMLEMAGFKNAFENKIRYPQITIEELKTADPQVIFLSSEPYPFKEKHVAEMQSVFPNAIVQIVDGEMFSWYGSRLVRAADYFMEKCNGKNDELFFNDE